MNTITVKKVVLVNKKNITGSTAKSFISRYNLMENEDEIDIMPVLRILGVTNIKTDNDGDIRLTIGQADIDIITCISELFDTKNISIRPIEVPDSEGNYIGYYELEMIIK